MSEAPDRERDVLAACVLPMDTIRSGGGPASVRKTSLEIEEQTFEGVVRTKMKPCVADVDPTHEPSLLIVALALVAVLAILAISLFWPYFIPFVIDQG